jgi:chemotaxis protein CheC
VQVPNELQLDALREIVNVGGGHAATALSRLVGGKRVEPQLPRVSVRRSEDAGGLFNADAPIIAATFELGGDWAGRMLLLMTEQDGYRLSALLLGAPWLSTDSLGEPQRGALAEAANIIGSACLSAMGRLVGHRLVPSVPTILHGAPRNVLRDLWAPSESAQPWLVLEARFAAQLDPPLSGCLLVLPDPPSVKALLARMGV